MTLSYTLRLFSVLTIVAGLVLVVSQFVLALTARTILQRLDSTTPRRRERLLYLLQIGPALLAVFVAAALCLPAYLHGETNLESENVSRLCLLVAAVVLVWFAAALFRGLRITVRTLRFARACRRSGQILSHTGIIPVLALPDSSPPVRLIGFFRPLILVSSSLTGVTGTLGPGAFDLALAHERSHAAHRDNWKLLTLSFLPRIEPLLLGGDPWRQHWQRAADLAADDDAVGGDPARSLLLAECLLIAARAANSMSAAGPPCICTALTSADVALAARIDRLIHPRRDTRPTGSSLLFAVGALALVGAAAACALSPWIYAVSERLLHLGA